MGLEQPDVSGGGDSCAEGSMLDTTISTIDISSDCGDVLSFCERSVEDDLLEIFGEHSNWSMHDCVGKSEVSEAGSENACDEITSCASVLSRDVVVAAAGDVGSASVVMDTSFSTQGIVEGADAHACGAISGFSSVSQGDGGGVAAGLAASNTPARTLWADVEDLDAPSTCVVDATADAPPRAAGDKQHIPPVVNEVSRELPYWCGSRDLAGDGFFDVPPVVNLCGLGPHPLFLEFDDSAGWEDQWIRAEELCQRQLTQSEKLQMRTSNRACSPVHNSAQQAAVDRLSQFEDAVFQKPFQ